MAGFKILGRLERDGIPDLLPPDYRAMVLVAAKPGLKYTVVLFAHNRTRGAVTTSAVVRRALAKLTPAESILAVGHDFTVEATRDLGHRGAIILRIGEYGWTDASYASLRERAT